MPMAIPLVVAAFEAYAGATAIAAGVEGLAAVAAGLEVAGAALTVVGTVTGNKNLSMLGSLAGLGGGLASFAGGFAGAGLDSAASSAANAEGALPASLTEAAPVEAAQAAGEGTSGLLSTANPALSAGAEGAPGELADTGMVGAVPNPNGVVTPTPGAPDVPAAPGTPQTGFAGPGAANTGNAGPDYGSSSGAGAPGSSATTAPGATAPAQTGAPPAVSNGAQNQSWFGKLQSTLGGATDWAKQNPELTKVGAGLVQGAMGYYGSQQLAEDNLKRAKGYQDWVRQRYSDSVRNISVPTPTVTKGPSSGIIAGARS